MSASQMMPLDGIKVVDLTTIMFGPYATQFMAEFGANVIKVEAPGGDASRNIGPGRTPGMAAAFINLNRGKRSIELDLKTPEAVAALHRLLADADVLMMNVRPQKLGALGLETEALRARYPGLVIANLNGFASEGPYAGRPAYDDVIQGMCGMADLMHRTTGEGRYFPSVVADKVCGLIAGQAILSAIIQRERSGEGCHIEVPMFEAMVGFTLIEHWAGQAFIPPTGDTGYTRALAPSRRPFPTSDGFLTIMPYSDQQWQRFLRAIGRDDLAEDERFIRQQPRTQNINELLSQVMEVVKTRTSAEWIAVCNEHDIPVAEVIGINDLAKDRHLQAVNHFQRVEEGDGAGPLVMPGNGIRFNGGQVAAMAPPRLGQHGAEILREAGFSEDEIDALTGAQDRKTKEGAQG